MTAAVKVGDKVRRVKDGRVFRITFVNTKAQVPVFSADPLDGKWSHWGGPLSQLRLGETIEKIGNPVVSVSQEGKP